MIEKAMKMDKMRAQEQAARKQISARSRYGVSPALRLQRPAAALRWISLLALTLLLTWPPGAALAQESGISSPTTGSAISGDVPVLGTAVIEPFQKYELHYKQDPSSEDAYIYFGGGTTPVVNGQLATWSASGLPPGAYSLRLRVVKTDGNYAQYFSENISVNQGPAATPTSDQPEEPTPTPIPTATFTPAPQPTPEVGQVVQPGTLDEAAGAEVAAPAEAVAQPAIVLPTPTPGGAVAVIVDPVAADAAAADADPASGSVTRELGAALALDRLRGYFYQGMRISAMLFLSVGLVFGARRLFAWLRSR